MGIQGLLPLLKSIMNPVHIKELEGCFVAVDTYSWLHKGALSCSTDLCKGRPTSKHIDYCMHRVNMLRHYGVKPILVFDGGPLPMKIEQEIKRARSRKENLSRALEHEANGNRSAAYECYQKAVDISPSVAYDLIQVLKKENVSYVVAPYEADAQMTFLALNKQVDAVITEDSDLIAFGCPRIIYKMDKFGQGVEFKSDMLQYNKELNLSGFTQTMLLEMCILSGCDYLQSLPGMGLKKAHALMTKFKSHENVIKHLKYSNIEVSHLYEESFKKAILTFRHQRVYDPTSEEIVHLSEPVDLIDVDLDFLGPSLPQHVAKGIAEGDLDPFNKEPIQGNRSAAYECYQKAVDISPSVAYDLIQVLKKENVSYVVAPYEADAQMTFLALNKQVDAVITEDSDLIAFGCPRIIYKMDKFGQGVEFKSDMLQYNKELNLSGFTQTMLLEMCILSGCDYLQSLPGMGLKKAHALMTKFKSHENVIKHLKYSNIEVSHLYEESFKKAILTFRHQRVYDPTSEEIVHLSEPVDLIDVDLDFLGPSLPQHVAKGIAEGDLDPFNKEPIQKESGATENEVPGTYQLKNFKPDGERRKLDLPVQKNLLTNYFCFASLAAKRKFRAPRITPNNPYERNENSSLHVDEPQSVVKCVAKSDESKPTEARDRRIETKPFTAPQNAVCKPCISSHRDLDSDRETGKGNSGDKNVPEKSRDENGNENENEEAKGTCRKEGKRIVVKSHYFRRKNTENADCASEKSEADCKITVDSRKQENPPSAENNSLDCTIKKRKIAHPTEDAIENKRSTGKSWCVLEYSEEDTKHEEEKLACNISHLGSYSNIAEKTMENFVSVLSSFKYNSSGSRASGLRAPLKDIKNYNCMQSSTGDDDLRKFGYAPTKQTTASRRCKSKI